MTIKSFNTVQDLVDAVGVQTYMAIFDDPTGTPPVPSGSRAVVDASTQVASVLQRARSRVLAWLPGAYDTMPDDQSSNPSNVSVLMKDAELQYAVIYTYRRHPEYVRTYGAEASGPLMKEADAHMQRIKQGQERIAPNDNPPPGAPKPNNVGGVGVADGSRITITGTDGTSNAGDF